MRTAVRAWHRFWFRPAPPDDLAVARLIFFGTFPFEQQWRPFFAAIIMLAMLIMTSDRRMWQPWRLAAIWSIGSFFTFLLMFGQVAFHSLVGEQLSEISLG